MSGRNERRAQATTFRGRALRSGQAVGAITVRIEMVSLRGDKPICRQTGRVITGDGAASIEVCATTDTMPIDGM